MSSSTLQRPWSLAVLFVVTALAFAVSLVFMSDYLTREMSRLEPWKAVLLWTSDIVVLFWFCRFFVQHFVRGSPLRTVPVQGFRHREWLWAVTTLLLGIAADVGITLALIREEQREFAGAEIVAGEALAVRSRAFPRYLYHELTCRYQDKAGDWHEQPYLIREDNFAGFPPNLPRPLVEAIRKQQAPFPVRVSYAPLWPERSWLTDFGPVAGNRLHYFSLVLPIVQLLFLFPFVVILGIVVSHTKYVPWWFEMHKLMPFLAEVVVLAACGIALYFAEEWYFVWMWPE